jgi:hypothetical protein
MMRAIAIEAQRVVAIMAKYPKARREAVLYDPSGQQLLADFLSVAIASAVNVV